MPIVTDDEIYDELTAAFKGRCTRQLTQPAGEAGLREFIRVSVILGHHLDPNLYHLCREYLKCRFESIAAALNLGTGGVTWTQIKNTGSAEVDKGIDTPCVGLLTKEYWTYVGWVMARTDIFDDSASDYKDANPDYESATKHVLKLCLGYQSGNLQPPPGGID